MAERLDWTEARRKVDRERSCRIQGCRVNWGLEAAHVIDRSVAKSPGPKVPEDDIVPLCKEHHGQYDAHRLDLLPVLTKREQAKAVFLVGVETMRMRTLPSAYTVQGRMF